MANNMRMYVCLAGTALSAIGAPFAALAQDTAPAASAQAATPAAGAEDGIGDIIVTAQKRSESINRVAMSITAESGDALASKGITTVADLVRVVPGFNFTPSSYGAPVYTLRGVGFYDTSLGSSPAVSVYVDEVPLPYSVMTVGATLDLDRVEVLKGPQGTLFGSNSTGGAINYVAAKPTATAHAGADISFGRFNDLKVSGFSSGPISSTLRARVAASYNRADGWQQSYTRKDTLGRVDTLAARLLLDWTPTDRLTVTANLNGWRDRSDNLAGQLIAVVGNPARVPQVIQRYPRSPAEARAADWTPGREFRRDNRFLQGTLRADYDIADATTLTVIGSYEDLRRDGTNDADGTDQVAFEIRTPGRARVAFGEFRLANDGDALRWVIGGNYQYENVRDGILGDSTQGSFPFDLTATRNQQKVDTWAGFVNASYQLTSTISLQAGARYTDQARSFVSCLYDGGSGQLARYISGIATARSGQTVTIAPGGCATLGTDGLPVVYRDQLNQDNVSWRASVNWQAGSSALLYANVSRGYKSGVFPSVAATSVLQLAAAPQESLTAYEAGFKLGLAGRTLQLNGAAFYYDYADKQFRGKRVDPILGPFNALVNIPKSRVAGAEIQAAWRPVRALSFNLGATYIDTKVLDGFTNFDPLGTLRNFGGQAFPLTPKWQLTGDVEYRAPLSDRLEGFVGAGATYQSSTNAGLGELSLLRMKAYALVDARLGVRGDDGRWNAGLFVRNLTDTYYWNYVSTTDPDAVLRLAAMPRTYGVTFGFRY